VPDYLVEIGLATIDPLELRVFFPIPDEVLLLDLFDYALRASWSLCNFSSYSFFLLM
jgi:hypothetical protein